MLGFLILCLLHILTLVLSLLPSRYDQLLRKSSELKEQAGKEIIRILTELIDFKSHVEKSLAELYKLAEQEYRSTVNGLP